ncbi:MAG: crossover junction endodeoxyribonuclease RuvC [Nanoarchaeota archaeon]|nr:crossover junction endodeoxyribonuclease RuvC [Nanoarchaeota archaeon]
MVILGIDPGTTRVGYGLIRKEAGGLQHLASGLFPIPPGDLSSRLFSLHAEAKKMLVSARPDRAGIEQLYFFKNQKTAIEVAEARGVLLFTLAEAGVPIVEITPLQVKLGVAGSGNASKKAVASMVFRFLGITPRSLPDDVTDALAVAIAVSGNVLSR